MTVKFGFNYVIETKEANDTQYELLGYHDEFSLSQKDDYSTKKYLPDSSTSDSFGLKLSAKKGREITLNTKYMPVNLDSIKKFYITSSNSLNKYSIGIINKYENKYSHTDEAIIKSISLEIPENDICSCSIDFNCESFTYDSDTDYADGTNILHGTLPNDSPLTTVDLNNVYWGTISLSPTKLTLKIEYDLKNKWDVENDKMRYYMTDRKITVEIELADVPSDFITDIMNGVSNDFSFYVGTQQITVKDVKFPELKLSVKPDDIITESFTSLETSEIVFGF